MPVLPLHPETGNPFAQTMMCMSKVVRGYSSHVTRGSSMVETTWEGSGSYSDGEDQVLCPQAIL